MRSERIFYHAPGCALSQAVQLMLVEKCLDHELLKIDVTRFEQFDPGFLALYPSGQVPALEFDGAVLTEAFFILCWLDERFSNPPLGGKDPAARYRVQMIGQAVERAIAPNLALLEWAEAPGEIPPDEALERLPPERRALWRKAASGFSVAEITAADVGLARALAECEQWLAGHAFLAGEEFTLADILLFPLARRIAQLGPATVAWRDNIGKRPSTAFLAGEAPFATMGPERGRWG